MEIDKEYINDLNKIKETIRQNQNKAMIAVNSTMIMTYYNIGLIINKRKSWGNKYIERLSYDLSEYGKGFSLRNLKYISEFAKEFTFDEIRQQPVAQIPWSTLVTVIMSKSNSHNEMLWYINETYKHSWSRSMVLNQMSLKAYERSLITPDTTEVIKSDDSIKEIFKDTYVFDFLDINKIKTEKDLKNQMIDNIIKFLQELGDGFSFVGKEYKLVTPSNEDFYVDLLMYHIKVHSYVVIEVKLRKFKPEDFGQLVFYVNAMNKLEKGENDNETIGILLCKETDNFVVETTLNTSKNKIGISKYKFINELPEYLIKRLNETNK